MDTRGIAAELARVRVHPSDRCAALARDFGERDDGGKRLVYRHHTRAGLGKVLGHEAGVGAVEQAPVAAVYENKDWRWSARRRWKNVESLGLSCAIRNSEPAGKARAHSRTFGGVSG